LLWGRPTIALLWWRGAQLLLLLGRPSLVLLWVAVLLGIQWWLGLLRWRATRV